MKKISELIALLSKTTPFNKMEKETFYEAIAGNRHALLALIQKRINLLFSVLSPFDENHDLRNETYVECCFRLNELHTPDELHFWLACIVRSVLRDAARGKDIPFSKLNSNQDILGYSIEENIPDRDDKSPFDNLSDREEQRILAEAISDLSEQDNIIYNKIHQEHMGVKETAHELGVTVRTIQRRVKEIPKKIQTIVKKKYHLTLSPLFISFLIAQQTEEIARSRYVPTLTTKIKSSDSGALSTILQTVVSAINAIFVFFFTFLWFLTFISSGAYSLKIILEETVDNRLKRWILRFVFWTPVVFIAGLLVDIAILIILPIFTLKYIMMTYSALAAFSFYRNHARWRNTVETEADYFQENQKLFLLLKYGMRVFGVFLLTLSLFYLSICFPNIQLWKNDFYLALNVLSSSMMFILFWGIGYFVLKRSLGNGFAQLRYQTREEMEKRETKKRNERTSFRKESLILLPGILFTLYTDISCFVLFHVDYRNSLINLAGISIIWLTAILFNVRHPQRRCLCGIIALAIAFAMVFCKLHYF